MEGVSRAGSLGQYHSLHLWVQPLGDHASGEEGRTGGGKRVQARCYHVSVQTWNPQGCWEALENQSLLLLGPRSSSLGVVREASWPLPWGGAGHLWREWGINRDCPGVELTPSTLCSLDPSHAGLPHPLLFSIRTAS